MSDITVRINNALSPFFETNDPLYKALICGGTGDLVPSATTPTGFDIGAVGSMLEYLRVLVVSLAQQIYLDKAEGAFLDLFLDEYFGIRRNTGETDAAWVARVQNTVFTPRVSRAAIIYALRDFSTQEPQIAPGSDNVAFAGLSFAGRLKNYRIDYRGSPFHVFAAYAANMESTMFCILITLFYSGTPNLFLIMDTIDKMLAAGISYILQILTAAPFNQNFYYCIGDVNTKIVLDPLNSQGGTEPADLTGLGYTAVYETLLTAITHFNTITMISAGAAYFSWCESVDGITYSAWSTPALIGASTTQAVAMKYLKLRFLWNVSTGTTTTNAYISSLT